MTPIWIPVKWQNRYWQAHIPVKVYQKQLHITEKNSLAQKFDLRETHALHT